MFGHIGLHSSLGSKPKDYAEYYLMFKLQWGVEIEILDTCDIRALFLCVDGAAGRYLVVKMTTLPALLSNIRAIMTKMKLPKKPHSIVIFLIKVIRYSRDLSSQADPARDN